MELKHLFEYTSYRNYLSDYFATFPARSGKKAEAAKIIQIHQTFLSQVLAGTNDFSLEQAWLCGEFLGLTSGEKKYFLLLVNYERAGSFHLKEFYKQEMEVIRAQRKLISERLGKAESISEEHQMIFYSSWHYQAIQALVSIPELRTREVLVKYLSLPLEQIDEALSFLCQIGLLEHVGGEYQTGQKSLHLTGKSRYIRGYHTNWRIRAIESVSNNRPNDFHYSAILTLSHEDSEKIRERLLGFISEMADIVRESPEQVGRGIVLDFFDLDKH